MVGRHSFAYLWDLDDGLKIAGAISRKAFRLLRTSWLHDWGERVRGRDKKKQEEGRSVWEERGVGKMSSVAACESQESRSRSRNVAPEFLSAPGHRTTGERMEERRWHKEERRKRVSYQGNCDAVFPWDTGVLHSGALSAPSERERSLLYRMEVEQKALFQSSRLTFGSCQG